MGYEIYGDAETYELVLFLDLFTVGIFKRQLGPLNRVLGPPPKISTGESPKLELKTLPSHLRYEFL